MTDIRNTGKCPSESAYKGGVSFRLLLPLIGYILPAVFLVFCSPDHSDAITSHDPQSGENREEQREAPREEQREAPDEKLQAPRTELHAAHREEHEYADTSDPQDTTKVINDTVKIADLRLFDFYDLFKKYDREDGPGCAVAVYRDGKTVVSAAFGMANLDYGIPLSDSAAFYMGSVAKQVTAAAASLLIVRGELNPESRVAGYLEDWPDWAEDVRIKHLFNHTSGLPDIFDLMDIAGISLSNVMDLDDYMSVLRSGESLKHRPGSQYSFTNSGYTVLASLIESVTGDDFTVFVDRELFQPLGMTATHFQDDRYRIIPNRAIGYAPVRRRVIVNEDNGEVADEAKSGQEAGPQYRQTYLSNFQGVGPGGLYSSLRDWRRWEAFWSGHSELPDGGESAELKRLLTERMVVDGDTLAYGKGLEISNWQGVRMEGHSGSFMGYETDIRRFPEYRLAVLTLCNRSDTDSGRKNRELARKLLKEPFEAFLEPYSGIYHNEELQVDYTISVKEGTLYLGRRLDPNGFMVEEQRDSWKAGSWDVVFTRNSNGEINGFLISTGRAREVEFIRK